MLIHHQKQSFLHLCDELNVDQQGQLGQLRYIVLTRLMNFPCLEQQTNQMWYNPAQMLFNKTLVTDRLFVSFTQKKSQTLKLISTVGSNGLWISRKVPQAIKRDHSLLHWSGQQSSKQSQTSKRALKVALFSALMHRGQLLRYIELLLCIATWQSMILVRLRQSSVMTCSYEELMGLALRYF